MKETSLGTEISIRDFKTMYSGIKDLAERISERGAGRIPGDIAAVERAQNRFAVWCKSLGSKMAKNGDLFVPNRSKKVFDGHVFYEKGELQDAIVISYVDGKDKYRFVGVNAYKVKTERGFCWSCEFFDLSCGSAKRMSRSDVCVHGRMFIKDHAVRRAMERSPIKDYENALGLILWTILKGDLYAGKPLLARVSGTPERPEYCTIAPFTYSLFGRVAGSLITTPDRLGYRGQGIRIHLVSTYLDLGMVPPWADTGELPDDYREV